MVLEIHLSNFFSIKDEIVLDLMAGSLNTQKSKALKHNVIEVGKTKVVKNCCFIWCQCFRQKQHH